METPVDAAQEVSIPAAKMTYQPGAALPNRCGWSWAFQNALICLKLKKLCHKRSLLPPWPSLADGKKYLGSAEKDKVQRPDRYSFPKITSGATYIPSER